jgi:hypothetical protein
VTGDELERAAAAVLQASGWFVLRGATDETFQAFELDVVGYRFDDGAETSIAIEAKGGKSGFNHLWKLLGLKTHLDIDRGVLMADDTEPLHDRKISLARQHGIAVVSQSPVDFPGEMEEAGLIAEEPDGDVLQAWQRCFRVEDALTKIINDKTLWAQWETIRLAKQQLQELTSKVWLEPDPWRQAVRLYRLFQTEPKIALRMAAELSPGQRHIAFKKALYRGSLPEVLACMYLEHRKRLAVAFAATRCAALGDRDSRYRGFAPASFREMVDKIASEEAWYLPSLLQVYFLGFGAMVCLDDVEAELGEMAAQAQCSRDEAERALALFADLFWTPDGWFHERDEISVLKLVPPPIRGAGIWMREAVYGRPWDEAATELQFASVGKRHRALATVMERTVLPQPPPGQIRRIRRRRPG